MRKKRRDNRWDELDMPGKLIFVKAWCRDGATDKDIAKNLGVGLTTFYSWKKKYPELVEVLKKNKEYADIKVVNALYDRAIGYEYEETREEVFAGNVKTTTIKKQVIPDVTAQIFWLKNRKRDVWRDRQDHTHSGDKDNPLNVTVVINDTIKESNGNGKDN